tara:strand:+ start:129 stop:398 length:270 start_codon:yes stop_codon:yes gene_type:complete
MEDTFREVDATSMVTLANQHITAVAADLPGRGASLAAGDIFYVLKAGSCQVTFWDIFASEDKLWRSEVLGSKGLSYPSARWVLDHTSPV